MIIYEVFGVVFKVLYLQRLVFRYMNINLFCQFSQLPYSIAYDFTIAYCSWMASWFAITYTSTYAYRAPYNLLFIIIRNFPYSYSVATSLAVVVIPHDYFV